MDPNLNIDLVEFLNDIQSKINFVDSNRNSDTNTKVNVDNFESNLSKALDPPYTRQDELHRSTNYRLPTVSSAQSQLIFKRVDHAKPVNARNSIPSGGSDLSQVKSLELRIQGQIKTIRALESQLTQAICTNNEKEKLIESLFNKVKALENRDRGTKTHTARVDDKKTLHLYEVD